MIRVQDWQYAGMDWPVATIHGPPMLLRNRYGTYPARRMTALILAEPASTDLLLVHIAPGTFIRTKIRAMTRAYWGHVRMVDDEFTVEDGPPAVAAWIAATMITPIPKHYVSA